MLSCAVSRLVILLFGTLYPAYASYKAVKSKNVKEYVKWMMYWIVFALFTSVETFTDVFLAFWFPFYYEIKIILVLWLLSPATKGSSVLYRKFVHPQLTKREKDIDEYIIRAREHGYHAVLQLGSKGINYASHVLVQTALRGGGHVVNQLQRSYSLGHLETQDAASVAKNELVTYQHEDQSDHADTGAEDESFPIDDLSEQQTLDIRAVESEPEVNLQRLTSSTRGRRRKGDAPSSGYSSTENLSTSAPSGVGADKQQNWMRQSTRIKGGRPTYTQMVNQPSMQTKKGRTEWGNTFPVQEEYVFEIGFVRDVPILGAYPRGSVQAQPFHELSDPQDEKIRQHSAESLSCISGDLKPRTRAQVRLYNTKGSTVSLDCGE